MLRWPHWIVVQTDGAFVDARFLEELNIPSAFGALPPFSSPFSSMQQDDKRLNIPNAIGALPNMGGPSVVNKVLLNHVPYGEGEVTVADENKCSDTVQLDAKTLHIPTAFDAVPNVGGSSVINKVVLNHENYNFPDGDGEETVAEEKKASHTPLMDAALSTNSQILSKHTDRGIYAENRSSAKRELDCNACSDLVGKDGKAVRKKKNKKTTTFDTLSIKEILRSTEKSTLSKESRQPNQTTISPLEFIVKKPNG